MPKKSDKSSKRLVILVICIITAFALLFSIKLFYKQEPEGITGLIAKTLKGEQNPETNYLYNGFVFIKVGPLWQTQWQSDNKQYNILLHHGPLELEDIIFTGSIDERFHSDEIYITFDPLGSQLNYVALANGELSLNLIRAMGFKLTAACTRNETDACKIRPIINCTNTDKPVIFFKEDPETKIDLRGNCIVLQGYGPDIVKVTDRLILQWYGIMK